jgi:hypothetical protein
VYKVDLPITVPVSKAKSFPLNMNHYRNAHHHTLNKAKRVFFEQVSPLLKGLPYFQKIQLVYTLFPPSKRELDVANVCSIVDKFFSDTMVQSGRITDDNFKFLPTVSYQFGSIDRDNPRVEVEIQEL